MKKYAVMLSILMGLGFCGCGASVQSKLSVIQNADTSKAETLEIQNENTAKTEQSKIQKDNTTEILENKNIGVSASELEGKNIRSTNISQGGPYGKISISIPDGWSYELCPIDSESLMSGKYGIHFYPEDAANGYIELAYVDAFGICGTGLEEETAEIAGNQAVIATYDNQKYWQFVIFKGDKKDIVAITYSVEDWWDDYSNQVLDILDTLTFDKSVKEGGAYVYHEESEIEKIGLNLSLKNISSTGAMLVFYQYDTEAPEGELIYGDDFLIERKENDKWVSVPVVVEGEYGFNDIAYMIAAGEEVEKEMNWEWLYGGLMPGEYRIKKSVDDFLESGKFKKYDIYAHFILN